MVNHNSQFKISSHSCPAKSAAAIQLMLNFFCRLVSLIPSVVGQFETMFGNTTEWMLMEHIIHVVDVAVLSLKDRLDDIYGMTQLFHFLPGPR